VCLPVVIPTFRRHLVAPASAAPSNAILSAARLVECFASDPPRPKPSIDVQLRLVRACLVSSVRDLKLPHIVHENRAENAGHKPRSKQSAVNRADVMSTDQIAQVCRNRREAAAVHGQEDGRW
jgi:hypothetical protein